MQFLNCSLDISHLILPFNEKRNNNLFVSFAVEIILSLPFRLHNFQRHGSLDINFSMYTFYQKKVHIRRNSSSLRLKTEKHQRDNNKP